jgi:hypothetical protein
VRHGVRESAAASSWWSLVRNAVTLSSRKMFTDVSGFMCMMYLLLYISMFVGVGTAHMVSCSTQGLIALCTVHTFKIIIHILILSLLTFINAQYLSNIQAPRASLLKGSTYSNIVSAKHRRPTMFPMLVTLSPNKILKRGKGRKAVNPRRRQTRTRSRTGS